MASSPRDLPEERLSSATDVCKGKQQGLKNENCAFFRFLKNPSAIITFVMRRKERK